MSYFPELVNDEIADGVFVERRELLKVSAFAVGTMLLGWTSPLISEVAALGNGDGQKDIMDFDTLMEKVLPKAKELVAAKNPDEEAYLELVMAWAKKVTGVSLAKDRGKRNVQFNTMFKTQPIKVYQIRIKPGAQIPFHDHREYNGVIQVLQGSAHVRNFDFENRSKNIYSARTFRLKETQNAILKKGAISHLSRYRDNIHNIKAGKEGVTFLDIFTFFNKKAGSKYLYVDKEAVDKEKRIFKASWKKPRARLY
jgi:predicted metal-dependent enzyme (double-stranded beta helix superfamily)